MTTMTASEFNHDVNAAKEAAIEGPVLITERLSMSGAYFEFDPPRMDGEIRTDLNCSR